MTEKAPVIAVDGPSGSGKGVVATHLAEKYTFHLLDSGALYRLVGVAARQAGIDLDAESLDEGRLGDLAFRLDVAFEPTGDPEDPLILRLSGENVTDRVRSDAAGVDASRVAAIQRVRDSLFALQQSFRREPGLVADGRDMGTVVFPDADVKIYLTASAEARAERRYNQLKHKDIGVSLHDLFHSIQARDERDMSREASPLRPADDAYVIDSTDMTIEEVLDNVLALVTEKLF
ncbi:MAG: (d)CMP kinase [Gammaproteobacteria bacterium]|jgi:CMP/dCMP kinase|nr:(d)CMP kinase [Gammaproteobacteria bacterium]MBT4493532.1 (d)CMP kinase [Gammaproteobacteria bacterium]MBT7370459.1 (d)CMP kinase [Gammaproteobacteria bacterium]